MRHLAKCTALTKSCGYCQSPSPKTDLKGHERRCELKYQLIDSSNGAYFCKICEKGFKRREYAMVHISRSHKDWKSSDVLKSCSGTTSEVIPQTPSIQISSPFEFHEESFQVTIEPTTEQIEIKHETPSEIVDSNLDFLEDFSVYSDLKIIVNEEFSFDVHKILLARASPYFHTILQNPNGNGELHLNCKIGTITELLR